MGGREKDACNEWLMTRNFHDKRKMNRIQHFIVNMVTITVNMYTHIYRHIGWEEGFQSYYLDFYDFQALKQ